VGPSPRASVAGRHSRLRVIAGEARGVECRTVTAQVSRHRTAVEVRHGLVAAAVPRRPLQKGMLFQSQLGGKASAYNAFTALDLDGPLDAERLGRAFDAVLRRHPQLAGLFDHDAHGEPLLVIPTLPDGSAGLWPFERHDLSGMTPEARAAELARIEATAAERANPTDRFLGLVKTILVRTAPDRHRLLIAVHHLVVDGWSTPLLLRDLLTAYGQGPDALTPLAIGYPAVVHGLLARDRAASRDTWGAALAGATPTVLFDPARSGGAPPRGGSELARPAGLTEALRSRRRGGGRARDRRAPAGGAPGLGAR
ncbi:hypothetical protein GAY28_37430, partial [Azospirillum brasilense]|nr:hypothetical protein [Azospirillum brasilense]